jgi:hypothetical protein
MAKPTKKKLTTLDEIRGFMATLETALGDSDAEEEADAFVSAIDKEDQRRAHPSLLSAAWRVRVDRAIPLEGRYLLAWYAGLYHLHLLGRIDLSAGLVDQLEEARTTPAPPLRVGAAPAVEPDEVLEADEADEADELEPEEAPKNPTLAEMRRGLERLQAADLAWFSTARALIKNFWHWGRGVVLIGVRSILEHGRARGDEWLAALYLLHEAGVMDFAGGLDGAAVLARYNSPDKLLQEIDKIRAAFDDKAGDAGSEDAEEISPEEWAIARREIRETYRAAVEAETGALSVNVIPAASAAEAPVERPDLADDARSKDRLPAWVSRIGVGGGLLLPPLPEEGSPLTRGAVMDFLWSRRWTEPEAPVASRSGIVDLDEPHRYRVSYWSGSEFYTFGVRVETRKISKDALRVATGARVAEIERDEGEEVDRARRAEIEAAMELELLRRCVPAVEIVPVVWHPTLRRGQIVQGFCYVAGSAAQVEAAASCLGWPVASIMGSQSVDRVARLSRMSGADLRVADGAAIYPPDEKGKPATRPVPEAVLADFLLWLWTGKAATATRGRVAPAAPVGVSFVAGGKVKRVTIPDGSAGLVEAALALNGGRLQRLHLARWAAVDGTTERAELEIVLDLSDKGGLRLLKVVQPPDTDARWDELEGVIFARVEVYRRARAWISSMISEWCWDRKDAERWVPVITAAREKIGATLIERYTFDPRTGQGFLFAPTQTTLPALPVPKKNGRGRAS